MLMFSRSLPTVPLHKVKEEYDYIIVGGGTAGCVLANRLTCHSAHKRATVLVLELGGVDTAWQATVPALSHVVEHDPKRASYCDSLPLKHGNGRSVEIVSGKSLGGSSSINELLYTRGIPAEFNAWAAAGRKGWHYDDLQPWFMKAERNLDHDSKHPPDFHGVCGEWPNRSYSTYFWGHSSSIIKAASAMGVPYVEDLNSPLHPPHGCAQMHYTIDEDGKRSSTSTAFLSQYLVGTRKEYLHVCTHVRAQKIVTEVRPGGNIVAVGVLAQAADGSGSSRIIRAQREVILCAGAIGSPHILLLSGIGPVDQLKEHGIPAVKDLSGVGSHLQDHVGIPLGYSVPMHDSITKLQARPMIFVIELFKYLFFGWGLLLNPAIELCVFIQTRLFDEEMKHMYPTPKDCDPSLPQNLPDVEVTAVARGNTEHSGSSKTGNFTLLTKLLRPTSTGSVKLANNNPAAKPIVDLNYLATEKDMTTLRKAVKFALELREHVVAQGYPMLEEFVPLSTRDEDINEFIRRTCVTTSHYASTCRMAPKDEGGVIDDGLRVHGVRGLRVADASIFPSIPGTHLMAPTVVVAERCADMVWSTNLDKFTSE
ncbi:hypothetical protein QCA50_004980 [Cerrena zonata]|uniref:Glucose-methanol-choline oxidoreductase N-terminal domain-containing protein n=1 Tax=Cerrena zonata TaxID=2478898 RepID=A0AAW0GDV8_9APHY